jgi:uncharacterized protein YjiS (DUF1127 family)
VTLDLYFFCEQLTALCRPGPYDCRCNPRPRFWKRILVIAKSRSANPGLGRADRTNAIRRSLMSTLSITPRQRQRASTRSSSYGLFATFKRWWITYLNWQRERVAIAHLSRLSDRELKDIGLHRSQIPSAVRGDATSPRMSVHRW